MRMLLGSEGMHHGDCFECMSMVYVDTYIPRGEFILYIRLLYCGYRCDRI